MTALSIFATSRPTQRGMAGVPLQPMSAEDRQFWKLRARRTGSAVQPAPGSEQAGGKGDMR